jgi:hypothetical protein
VAARGAGSSPRPVTVTSGQNVALEFRCAEGQYRRFGKPDRLTDALLVGSGTFFNTRRVTSSLPFWQRVTHFR